MVQMDFDNPKFSDLVRCAKFHICQEKQVLFWDPVWDHYSDEFILIEYYAMLMQKDQAYLQEFESLIVKSKGGQEEDIAWMQKKMTELKKEKAEAAEDAEEFEETMETLGK